MKKAIAVLTLFTILLFTVSAIAADKVVVVPLGKKPTGDAVAADVLTGKTFSNKVGVGLIGTAPLGKKPTGDAVAADVLIGKTFSNKVGVGLIGTAPPARVAETGITKCYEADGLTSGEIPCAGTGQDGELLNGAAIPVPRFTENNNGTVTDNLTGLVWLQDASCWLNRPWALALELTNNLSDGDIVNDCGLSDGSNKGDWRLPSLRELQSLINYAYQNPAVSNAAGTGGLDNPGDPFFNIQLSDYWSSTTHAGSSQSAWFVNFEGGGISIASKSFWPYYVWPVRD